MDTEDLYQHIDKQLYLIWYPSTQNAGPCFCEQARNTGPCLHSKTTQEEYKTLNATEEQKQLIDYCEDRNRYLSKESLEAILELMDQGIPASIAINLSA